MVFPPSEAFIKAIAEDIQREVAKRKNGSSRWCGGTIPSNHENFFADVDPQGGFKKVFFKKGEQKEYFLVNF